MGSSNFRLHFHLLLSCLIGPALRMWFSKHSIFAKRTNFLHRAFLRSGWGWTCIFVGLLTFSVHRSLSLALWVGFRKLLDVLENSTGSCYEPFSAVGVSDDIFLLRFRCLLLAKEEAIFRPYLTLGGPSGTPLQLLFLFCVILLGLWVFLLLCVPQILGGSYIRTGTASDPVSKKLNCGSENKTK
uniref:Uncharacterized protein n=1 Tax=Salmo trutta TaxID=8032 RepID=A0A674DRP6_SALTR